jgi:hypothetical protein
MPLPAQRTRPAWQETWHVPAEQTWPAPQAVPALAPVHVPEAPQKSRSVCGLTQAPAQAIWPAGQLVAQAPAEQTWPDAQTVPAVGPVQAPEAPQKERSVCGLTQVPLQTIWPTGQLVAQVPAEQTWPEAQGVPSLPPVHVPEAPQ